MVHSEPQVVPLLLALVNIPVLLLASAHRPYLIGFSPISTRNQLGMQVIDARFMGDFSEIFICFICD